MKYAVISGEYPQADKLLNFGITPLKTCLNRAFQRPVAYHADMNIAKIDEEIFIAESQRELISQIEKIGYNPHIIGNFSPDYPNDVPLNVAVYGKTAVINRKTALPEIVIALETQGYRINYVNQGYTGCSLLFVNEKAAVTTDSGIYSSLHNVMDILLISPDGITLAGYDYGFIGGSARLIDEKFMLFFGDVSKHRDYDDIRRFLKKHDVDYDCLPGYLCDIGGAVIIDNPANDDNLQKIRI